MRIGVPDGNTEEWLIRDCVFNGNSSGIGGAVGSSNIHSTTVENNLFDGNFGVGDYPNGSALYISQIPLHVLPISFQLSKLSSYDI